MRQPVVGPDHERRERVAGIEDRRDRRLLGPALGRRCDRRHGLARSAGIAAGTSGFRGIRAPLGRLAAGLGHATGNGDEAHVDGPSDEPLERRTHLHAVLVLKPLTGERVGDADAEDVIFFTDDIRLFEPRVVVRLRHRELQVAKGGLP